MHLTRQSIVFVFATIVLCADIKHCVASPTMAITPNNCLQRQMGIIPTPTTDFVGATKSMRFCNDDTFIHTAPDRGCKANVTHTTPCVEYCPVKPRRQRTLVESVNTLNQQRHPVSHTSLSSRQSRQHSVLHNTSNILNNTLCCITF
jgi:hypothetical protein